MHIYENKTIWRRGLFYFIFIEQFLIKNKHITYGCVLQKQ